MSSAAAIEYEITQDAPPASLLPWVENPYRLVSLLDMLRFSAHHYVVLSKHVGNMMTLIELANLRATSADSDPNERVREAFAKRDEATAAALDGIQRMISDLREECIGLGLDISVAQIDRIMESTSVSNAVRISLFSDLISRIQDELRIAMFLKLTYSESEHYNKPFDGWEEVIERFPLATTDIEEMNKCFALSRYAGAVFHSVQAIECTLIEFGKFIAVNDPKSGWTAVNKRLEALVIKTKYQDLEPIHQKHFAFLEQMQATVGVLNSAWRNKISHAQGRMVLMTSEFSPEVAEEIMTASRSFMRRLATELP